MALLHTILTSEAINATTRVEDLLFTGVKRVTFGTNVDHHILAVCRARGEGIATAALDVNFLIIRVNVRFHLFKPRYTLSQGPGVYVKPDPEAMPIIPVLVSC